MGFRRDPVIGRCAIMPYVENGDYRTLGWLLCYPNSDMKVSFLACFIVMGCNLSWGSA
jgi:hypothetical protein